MTSVLHTPGQEAAPSSRLGHEDALNFSGLPLQNWPPQLPSPHHPEGNSPVLTLVGEPVQYRLGEPGLPLAPYRDQIVRTIAENQTSVISSETGSGKSSQTGLYLLEAGFNRIFVTQPRIIAARELMQRARENLGEDNAHLAGYLTGNADDSDCPEDARLIYVTEDLLFKMVNRGMLGGDDVIINDEAHERTTGTVVLLGRLKQLLPENPDMRLVISSATIDTDTFANYLGPSPDCPAPVLELPGRTYPTTFEETDDHVAAAMEKHIEKGLHVIGFQPAITALMDTSAEAQRRSGEKVHMLYGDQSPRQQKEALDPNSHVVANKVGETSLTPQGKDVVVDSGTSNLGGYEAGVRVLKTVFSSIAVLVQRKGRVGRTKPGHYVLATPAGTPPPPAYEDRPQFDPPSIENSSVASYILELLSQGTRLEDLPLMEHPTHENLAYDHTLLRRLGATAVNEAGELTVTDVGREMTDLPLDTNLARMLVEARQSSEGVDINLLSLQVAALTAIHQVNGILNMRQGSRRRYLHRKPHQEMLSNERSSDVLFGLDVFTWLYEKQQEIFANDDLETAEIKFEKLLIDNDILPNRYNKAVATYEELCRRLELDNQGLEKADAEHRSRIVACQITGTEDLFVQHSKLVHFGIRGERRTLGRRTTISSNLANLVIGTAFDLRGFTSTGRYQRKFIIGGTVVTTEQLLASVPHRIRKKSLGYGVSRKGSLVEKQALYFDNELEFARTEADLSPTRQTRTQLITAMMTGIAPSVADATKMEAYRPGTERANRAIAVWKQAQELEHKSHVNLNTADRMAKLIGKIVRQSLDPKAAEYIPLEITDPEQLDQIIPQVFRNALVKPTRQSQIKTILESSPDGLLVQSEDGSKIYLPVDYKNNIAYVTVSRDQRFSIRHDDFAKLQSSHDIKLRIGHGRYHSVESIFESLGEQRIVEEAKQARRQELRAQREEASVHRDGEQTRWERRSDQEREIEEQVKSMLKKYPAKRARKKKLARV